MTDNALRITIIGVASAALIATTVLVRDSQDVGTTKSGAEPSSEAPPSGNTAAKRDRDRSRSGSYEGRGVSGTIAGELKHDTLGLISSEIIYPQTNAWIISNHLHSTVVEAGGRAYHPKDGLLGIFREDIVPFKQRYNLVEVKGSGPVRIVETPLGRGAVQTWAQKRGEIRFTSRSGITGTLYLRDDSVVLDSR